MPGFVYLIQDGDTLGSICQQQCGDQNLADPGLKGDLLAQMLSPFAKRTFSPEATSVNSVPSPLPVLWMNAKQPRHFVASGAGEKAAWRRGRRLLRRHRGPLQNRLPST